MPDNLDGGPPNPSHARPAREDQPLAGQAGNLTCVRCGQEVRVNRDSYEIFERMHYVCFHYVFEHGAFDPDEECNAGGCPSFRLDAAPRQLRNTAELWAPPRYVSARSRCTYQAAQLRQEAPMNS